MADDTDVKVKEALQAAPPQRVAGRGFQDGQEGVAYAVRTAAKELTESRYADQVSSNRREGKDPVAGKASVDQLRVQLLKQLNEVELFAYSNQSALPASISGYCAPGIVPREEGSCKVRPVVDKAPAIAKVKEALATFDSLLAQL